MFFKLKTVCLYLKNVHVIFRKPGVGAASINMNASRKSSHSFSSRSVRTTGGGSRNNLFNSSSRKSVAIESSRAEKAQTKPPVQVWKANSVHVTENLKALLCDSMNQKTKQSHLIGCSKVIVYLNL